MTNSINTILVQDADDMMKSVHLMPLSLAQFINKRHHDLLPVDECFSRFTEAVQACKDHKEAFGFIPTGWADYMAEVKINVQFKENPTNEGYVDVLIQVQTKRLAMIMRIAVSTNEYEQEDLLLLSNTELEEVLEELFPIEKRMDKGSFGRGFNNKKAA
jgi:hypothetical protein